MCLQFHHIAFDGASETMLLADLDHAYMARSRGAAPRFSSAPSHLLVGEEEERSLASWAADDVGYWRETLAQCPPPCLPTPGSDNEAAARESVRHLDAATVRLLTLATARCGGPALSALTAGAAMALARRFEVDDVCVGTVTAAGFDPATDEVVGHLVNAFAVPLRGLRRPAEPVLTAAAEQLLDGLEHARTPFDELVRELRPDRDRHPWFEAWVVLQYPHRTKLDGRGPPNRRRRLGTGDHLARGCPDRRDRRSTGRRSGGGTGEHRGTGQRKATHMTADTLRATTADIWREVLEVGIDDDTDFFLRGGHSFAALRIIAG